MSLNLTVLFVNTLGLNTTSSGWTSGTRIGHGSGYLLNLLGNPSYRNELVTS